jgi:hypothetical protein
MGRFAAVVFAVGVIASVAVVGAGAGELRTWTATSGFTTEAEFVELAAGDLVRLKRKDGRELTVPLGQLSAADQSYVRSNGGAAPKPQPSSTKPSSTKPAAKPGVKPAASRAPADAVAFGGRRYKVYLEDISWTAAKAKCEAEGGMLACIGSPAEEGFLYQLATRAFAPGTLGEGKNRLWIGGELVDGKWTWVSGEAFRYAPRPIDPKAKGIYLRYSNRQWMPADNNPAFKAGFICEWVC